MYFDYIISPSRIPLISSPSPYPSKFMLFLFLSPSRIPPLPQTTPKSIRARKHIKINKKKITCCQHWVLIKCDGSRVPGSELFCRSLEITKEWLWDRRKGQKGSRKKLSPYQEADYHLLSDHFFLQIFFYFFNLSIFFLKKPILGLINFMYCYFEHRLINFCSNLCFLSLAGFVFLLPH